MNLVKISEDLKSVPLQALQAYMNGMNPEVPPYIAQAEMMRRQKAMEKQKLAEVAQGQMPSVKEQLEQSAGLMALQQQRQQQGMQQMAQQAQGRPMPTGEGVPQPERQPEGGVAALDIPEETFEMAGGGIVGFQAGGSTEIMELQERLQELEAARQRYRRANADTSGIDQAIAFAERKLEQLMAPPQAPTGAGRGRINPPAATEAQPTFPAPAQPPTSTGERYSPEQEALFAQRAQQYPGMADAWRAYQERFPGAGEPAPAAPAGIMAGGRPPAPAVPTATTTSAMAGLPAALPAQSSDQMSADLLKQIQGMQGPAVDLAAIGEQEKQLQKQTGVAALADRRVEMQRQYDEMTKRRPIEGLMAALGGASRGIGGVGQAALEATGAARDADLAFAQRMYELEAAPAEKSYGTQRDMLKEAQARANEWAQEQRKQGIIVQKDDIAARRALELEDIKQKNQLEQEGARSRTQKDVANIYANRPSGAAGAGGKMDPKVLAEYSDLQQKVMASLEKNPRYQLEKDEAKKDTMYRNELMRALRNNPWTAPYIKDLLGVDSGTAPTGATPNTAGFKVYRE